MSDSLVLAMTNVVAAWSRSRLPFEPRGSAVEFRTELRRAIAGLDLDGPLHALYASRDRALCDAENVLFYNVGMTSFRTPMAGGVVFERAFDLPEPPAGEKFGHYYLYEAFSGTPSVWRRGEVVSHWRARVPTRPLDAAAWWFSLAAARGIAAGSIAGKPFALDIRVPRGMVTIHTALKPMLDGVVAALHHDDAPSLAAVGRLAMKLGNDPDGVLELIMGSPQLGPLGPRRIVRPYRSGLQWNPADDLCVSCSVIVDPALHLQEYEGELLSVSASVNG